LLPSAIVKVKPAEDTSQNDKELRVRKIQSVEYCQRINLYCKTESGETDPKQMRIL
jgi:hypothetical protein